MYKVRVKTPNYMYYAFNQFPPETSKFAEKHKEWWKLRLSLARSLGGGPTVPRFSDWIVNVWKDEYTSLSSCVFNEDDDGDETFTFHFADENDAVLFQMKEL